MARESARSSSVLSIRVLDDIPWPRQTSLRSIPSTGHSSCPLHFVVESAVPFRRDEVLKRHKIPPNYRSVQFLRSRFCSYMRASALANKSSNERASRELSHLRIPMLIEIRYDLPAS